VQSRSFKTVSVTPLGGGIGTSLFAGIWPLVSSLYGKTDGPKPLGCASPASVERARVPASRRISGRDQNVGSRGTECLHEVLR